MGFRSDILSKWLYLRVIDRKMKRRVVVLKNMNIMSKKRGDKQLSYIVRPGTSFLLTRTDGDCLSECETLQDRLKMIINHIHFPLNRESRSCQIFGRFLGVCINKQRGW